jgi:hypothetical protein
MPTFPRVSDNRLLAALAGVALDRLMADLTLVELNAGDSIATGGAHQADVYFPVTATVSLRYLDERGVSTEVSKVGSEGVIGIPLFLTGDVSPCCAVVGQGGHAFRISATLLTSEMNRTGPALRLILAYARDLSAQMAHTARLT